MLFTIKQYFSPETLIVIYYIGAILLPFATWLLLILLLKINTRLFHANPGNGMAMWKSFDAKQKIRFLAYYLVTLLFMELYWLLAMDLFIAHVKIQNALYNIYL